MWCAGDRPADAGVNWRAVLATAAFAVVMYFLVFKWAVPLVIDAGSDIGK